MLPLISSAQNAISGKIIAGGTSLPIPSASVLVKGTKTGVATSAEGTFYITAKIGDILVISGIGIKTTEYKISTTGNQLITVEAEPSELNAVVVTALGIKKKPRRSVMQCKKSKVQT